MATSCEKFLNPEQELNITEDKLFGDWYEYRSVEMGLYGLQQKLVEQLFILGELRGDLVNITRICQCRHGGSILLQCFQNQ